MFAPRFFAARFFAPRFYPPAADGTIIAAAVTRYLGLVSNVGQLMSRNR